MDSIIAAPTSCEVCAVIHFIHAGQSAAKIHRRLCGVYGDNVMGDGCVREWCRKFRDGRTDVHDEGGQGRQCTAPHRSSHKCLNQALQLGDFRPPSLHSGPGTKRLPSLHQDEGLVGYPALSHQQRARGWSQQLPAYLGGAVL